MSDPTWIGPKPEPDDIRTWDGLEAIIDANEAWGCANIIEQMKAAGWRPPKPPTVTPDHDIDPDRAAVCNTCDRFIAWAGETQGWVHL